MVRPYGLSETKLDNSFHSTKFKIDEFSVPFRFDKNNIGEELDVHS